MPHQLSTTKIAEKDETCLQTVQVVCLQKQHLCTIVQFKNDCGNECHFRKLQGKEEKHKEEQCREDDEFIHSNSKKQPPKIK